jgi:hypothetical protein
MGKHVKDPAPDKTEIPWPHWLLRYVGSDDQNAMESLIWSVGGSPPYGGVSYEEASAVYDLIEAYRGPGAASAEAYARVETFTKANPGAQAALDIFRCCDEIQSNSNEYPEAPVLCGLALARQIKHRGAEGCFLWFDAGLKMREGDGQQACARILEALDIFLAAADEDAVYEKRARESAQNSIGYAAQIGDIAGARVLFHKLSGVLDPAIAEQVRAYLDAQR